MHYNLNIITLLFHPSSICIIKVHTHYLPKALLSPQPSIQDYTAIPSVHEGESQKSAYSFYIQLFTITRKKQRIET